MSRRCPARHAGSLAVALAVLWLSHPALGGERADAVRQHTGIETGLALVVGEGLELACDLAADGRLLVHLLAPEADAVAGLRAAVARRGLGGRVVVGALPADRHLPHPDRFVSLLVADLDALGKRAPREAELLRVLAVRGAAARARRMADGPHAGRRAARRLVLALVRRGGQLRGARPRGRLPRGRAVAARPGHGGRHGRREDAARCRRPTRPPQRPQRRAALPRRRQRRAAVAALRRPAPERRRGHRRGPRAPVARRAGRADRRPEEDGGAGPPGRARPRERPDRAGLRPGPARRHGRARRVDGGAFAVHR